MAFRGRTLVMFVIVLLVLSLRDADCRRGGSRTRRSSSRSSTTRRRVNTYGGNTGTVSTTGLAWWAIFLITAAIVIVISLMVACTRVLISSGGCRKHQEPDLDIVAGSQPTQAHQQKNVNGLQSTHVDAAGDEVVTAEPSETLPPPSYKDALSVPTAPDGQDFAR